MPFTDYFDLTTIKSYHKVITMEMFMKELAPVVWPPGHRAGNRGRWSLINNIITSQVIAMVMVVGVRE